jgi:hypothetical protein
MSQHFVSPEHSLDDFVRSKIRFAIDIAKDLVLLSCRLAMEHLCVLQLETLVTT